MARDDPTTTAPSAMTADKSPMTLQVNGETRQTLARTLAELIVEAGYGDAKIATALNGDFVPQRARAATGLKAGDHVEIVAPRQGG